MSNIGQSPIVLMPWTGGMDNVSNPTTADPQRIDRAINLEFAFDGTRTKRGGVKKYNSTPLIDIEDE